MPRPGPSQQQVRPYLLLHPVITKDGYLSILDASGGSGPCCRALFQVIGGWAGHPSLPGLLRGMQAGPGCSYLLPPADGGLCTAMRPTFLLRLKSKWLCSLWALDILSTTGGWDGYSRKSPVSCGGRTQYPEEPTPGMKGCRGCHLLVPCLRAGTQGHVLIFPLVKKKKTCPHLKPRIFTEHCRLSL